MEYWDQRWVVNSSQKVINGHRTDVATDSAIGFLRKVPDGKNFFLTLAYAAPHHPYEPRPQDSALYANDIMPLPNNLGKFSQNYPNFLYPCDENPDVISELMRGAFRLLAGVEYNVGRVLNQLTAMNALDSTLIIFTSDNGFFMGDHDLDEKRLAYEPSLHLPLYMRYPPQIAAGTVIDNTIAMNIDLAPTILDYINIPNTYSMDGISLKKMIEGSESRTEMFYEFFAESCNPDLCAVRSLNYKYTEYACSQTTQEFFDLGIDPEENNNLINNSAYDSLINVYRIKLEGWKRFYNYSTPGIIDSCHLANPVYLKQGDDETNQLPDRLKIYPNPSNKSLNIEIESGQSQQFSLSIFDPAGKIIFKTAFAVEAGIHTFKMDVSSFDSGIYFAEFQTPASATVVKFVKE